MGRYEIELDDNLEKEFKRIVKKKTGKPVVKVVRGFILAFIKNPDFFLDNLNGFLENKVSKK